MSTLFKRLVLLSFFTFLILVGVTAKNNSSLLEENEDPIPSPHLIESPVLIQEQAALRSLDFHHRMSRESSVKVHQLSQLPTQDRAYTNGHGSGTYFKFRGSYYILTACLEYHQCLSHTPSQ